MAYYRTENTLVTWAYETTPGVVVPTTKRFGIFETIQAPDPDMEWQPFWGVGSERNRQGILRGKHSLKGSIPDIHAQVGNSLADLLALAIGTNTGGIVAEGISTTDKRLRTFTMMIDMRDTDGHHTFLRGYRGGKVNKMTISGSEGEDLRVSIEEMIFQDMWIGSDQVPDRWITTDVPTIGSGHNLNVGTDPGWSANSRFLFAGATLTIFGQAFCRVKKFSITIDNMIEPRYYWCKNLTTNSGLTQLVSELVEGKRSYEMDLEVDMVDEEAQLFHWFLNEGLVTQTGPLTGGPISLVFVPTEGVSAGVPLQISFDAYANGGSTGTNVGGIITSGKVNMPAAPAGFHQAQFKFNMRSVSITVPLS